MNRFARQKQRHRCGEQTHGHQRGKWGWGGGGGGMNWDFGLDIYTLIYIKKVSNKNLLYIKTKMQKQKLCNQY